MTRCSVLVSYGNHAVTQYGDRGVGLHTCHLDVAAWALTASSSSRLAKLVSTSFCFVSINSCSENAIHHGMSEL